MSSLKRLIEWLALSLVGFLLTVCRFAMGGLFTANVYAEHKNFGYTKLSGSTKPRLLGRCCVRPVWCIDIPDGSIDRLSRECKTLMCKHRCALVSCKLVWSDPGSEESRCFIPPQRGLQRSVLTNRNYIQRHTCSGELAHLNEALQVQQSKYVDVAAIDQRISVLPGEIS